MLNLVQTRGAALKDSQLQKDGIPFVPLEFYYLIFDVG